MKDFEDSPICDKCTFDRTNFAYTRYAYQTTFPELPEKDGEFILVKCLRCGHEWGMKIAAPIHEE